MRVSVEQTIESVLDDIRPMLERDGGGVEIVSLEDGVLTLQLLGACNGCPLSSMTFGVVVEQKLREACGEDLREIIYLQDTEDRVYRGK